VEVARERGFDALAHAERAVVLDVDRDVGLEERERVGRRGGRERENRSGAERRER
jgi:hypothetical protein